MFKILILFLFGLILEQASGCEDLPEEIEFYQVLEDPKNESCASGLCYKVKGTDRCIEDLCPQIPAARNESTTNGPAINGKCPSGEKCYKDSKKSAECFPVFTCTDLPKFINPKASTGPAFDGDCKNGVCFKVNGDDSCFPVGISGVRFLQSNCGGWLKNGFCDTDDFYPEATRKAYCPKTCGFCTPK